FLVALGALGAWAGGAPMVKPALRVGFWGALAMAVTAGIGALIGKAVQLAEASTKLACLSRLMREQMPLGLVVELLLEGMLFLQFVNASDGRALVDLVNESLHIGHLRPGLGAQEVWSGGAPTPNRHIHNRIDVAEHVLPSGQPVVEDLPVPVRFEIVSIDRVFDLLGVRDVEVEGLAG